MKEIILTGAFGFLLAFQHSEDEGPYTFNFDFRIWFWQGFHLAWHTLVLVEIYFAAHVFEVPEIWLYYSRIGIFLAAAFGLSLLFKQSKTYALGLFAFCLFLTQTGKESFLNFNVIISLFGLVFGTKLFELLLIGSRQKLLLANVPKPLAGLPILLITAALLLMLALSH